MDLKKFLTFLGVTCLTALGLTITSCSEERVPKKTSPTVILADSLLDNHSYANIREVRTKHLHLDLDVNFSNQTVYGVARHEVINNGTDTAIFDIKGLVIQKITLGKGRERETNFIIGQCDKDSLLGQPLLVKITPDTKYINIYYETTDYTEAIDWLSPKQTSGKEFPFMYTQGQAILTRSWIPLQDSPNNRITYSANVRVPSELMAVMSATNVQQKNNSGKYTFRMDKPIPCYLIALAVGDLRFKRLSGNAGVYAEPEWIHKAANEFVDIPRMIRAAEQLYGKYRWGRYDVLVLPHSFPFGGMENPRLTFVSPSIIAGDRSLVSVVAHELAHSWSGNLVTNASWDDFWLNEGFTVYFEHRIMEELYGKEVADMLSVIEFQELKEEIRAIKESEFPKDACLKLNLRGRDPEDGLTDIAYVKGAFFLKSLEQKVGREKFDVFLKSYFENKAFTTLTTEQFDAYLKQHLLDIHDVSFNSNEWFYRPEIPSNCIRIRSERVDAIHFLARRFAAGEHIFKKKIKWVKVKRRKRKRKQIIQLQRNDYMAQEWILFLQKLPATMEVEQMKELDEHLHFKTWGNAEVASLWYALAIRSGYDEVLPHVERFLQKMGRRKFIVPIYKELIKSNEHRKWAKKVFEEAADNYHYLAKNTIGQLFKSAN
jgi:leukotriene-A4 hydrolase